MRGKILILFLVVFIGVTTQAQRTEAQFSACGHIIVDRLNITPIKDCANPFGAQIITPEGITLEGQAFAPGSRILIDKTAWGYFDFADNPYRYAQYVYKKVGENYHRVGQMGHSWSYYSSDYDQEVLALENKYYFNVKGYPINYSEFRRDNFPQTTPEMHQIASEFDSDYKVFTHLFETGEYVLLLHEVDEDSSIKATWLDKLRRLFTQTAHAQGDRLPGAVFSIPFTVEVAEDTEVAFPDIAYPYCYFEKPYYAIEAGDTLEIPWVTINADSTELWQDNEEGGAFLRTVGTNGTLTVTPVESTQYSLKVKNHLRNDYCDVVIDIVHLDDQELEEKESEFDWSSLRGQAAELAKQVTGAKYLGDGATFGGKGWDSNLREFITPAQVFSGYNYWHNAQKKIAFGGGLDCSGLIMWAYNRASEPKTSLSKNAIRYESADGQYRGNVKEIGADEESLKPGDLLFFSPDGKKSTRKTHVAMYVGDGQVVEAYDPEFGIRNITLSKIKLRDRFVRSYYRAVDSKVAMALQAGSPIDLTLTDPEGFTIDADTHEITESEYLREVPGELYYSEMVQGDDGRPADLVYSPHLKEGEYLIKVTPDETATVESTYSLTFTTKGIEHVLAKDELVSEAPAGGFKVTVAGERVVAVEEAVTDSSGETEPVEPGELQVKIDIMPFDSKNKVSALGLVPVVIFSTDDFDTTEIKYDSLKMFDAKAEKTTIKFDFNNDGKKDLLVFFFAQNFKDVGKGTHEATVTGETNDTKVFSGSDEITLRSFKRLNRLLETMLKLQMRLFDIS